MIVNTYYATCKLKKFQIFAILIQDLKYHMEKKIKPKTNLKNIISKEYYNLLDIFSKKDVNIFLLY